MTLRSIAATIVATTVGFTFVFTQEVAVESPALRVLASNGMKAAMEELQPQCERAIGHPLALQFNSTASLKKKIETGEGFDVAIITLFSEIVPIHGVEILGPLPGELHYDIRFAAAASATTKNAEAAEALITFLAGPKAEPTFKAKGLEPR